MNQRSSEQIEARWAAAAALATELGRRGVNQAPLDDLPAHRAELEELLAEGILLSSGGGVRFFHDRYLDYVFARSFAERGESLSQWLKSSEQHLERRNQVRKIISSQRDAGRELYEQTVAELLHDEGIRFHIKDVVFQSLREESIPTEGIWSTIREFVEDSERPEFPSAWRVARQPAWFRFLEGRGTIRAWLDSPERADQERGAQMLLAVVDDEPDLVAALLAPFLSVADPWGQWIPRILQFAEIEKSRGLFDLCRSLLVQGHYDENPESLWHAVHRLPDREPDWAAELLGAVFEHAYQRGLEQGQDPFQNDLFPAGHGMEEFLRDLAAASPRATLEILLPSIARTAKSCALEKPFDGAYADSVWRLKQFGSDYDLAENVLTIAERAARRLAEEAPADLHDCLAPLLEAIDFETPRFLLYRAWTENPAAFADPAMEAIAVGTGRLRCGYADSPFWVTRQLLEACSPRCADALFVRVEGTVVGFTTEYEESKDVSPYSGQSEWTLLSALDYDRLSARGRDRVAELSARFDFDIEELRPQGIRMGAVGSPLPAEEVAGFDDTAWLETIARWDSESTSWTDEGPVGGAEQIARQLEAAVKREPDRFARIGVELPDTANQAYFEAMLRGLGDTEAHPDPELVFNLLRRCHALPDRPCGRWFGTPLEKLADEEIDPDVLQMLGWYASNDPDPKDDSWIADDDGTEYWGGDIVMAGINSVRGTVAGTIARLIFDREERASILMADIEHLIADPVLSVRACAVDVLTHLTRLDAEHATTLFLQLVDTDDRLLRSPTIERYLNFRALADWDRLRPVLERMMDSELEDVQQAGARRFGVCALSMGEALEPADRALTGTVSQRKGIAEVAAANIDVDRFRELCERWLLPLFEDDDHDVREVAGGWARQIEPDHLGDLQDLAERFMYSAAYLQDPTMLLLRLEETRAAVPILMLLAAERFAQEAGRAAADISTSAAADAPHASNLAMRAYGSSDDSELRSRALDVIDFLLASGVRDIESRIAAYDD